MNSTVKSSLVTPPIKICSAESRDASPTVALPSGGSELSPMPVWRVCRDRSERHSYRAGFLLARQEEPRVVSKPISVEGDGRATRYTRASHPRSEAISAQRDGQFSNHSSNTPRSPRASAQDANSLVDEAGLSADRLRLHARMRRRRALGAGQSGKTGNGHHSESQPKPFPRSRLHQ